jgi:uncharacterized protein involved in exopolysaccharide biosynthesis
MFDAPTTDATATARAPAASPGRPGFPLDLRRIAATVAARARDILGAAVIALAVAVLLVPRFVAREYHSELSLLWEPEPTGADAAAQDEGRSLRTIADSLKLPVHLSMVRQQLRLDQTLERIGRRIDVTASTETRLIVVRAIGATPEEARSLAQTSTEVFLTVRGRIEGERLRERARALSINEAEARRGLDEARRRYDLFRQTHRVSNLPAEQLAAIEHSARLRADADLARAEAEGESARERALTSAARAQQPISVLSETQQVLGAQRLADTEGQLAAARVSLTDAHPGLRALEAQAAALRARADSAVQTGRIIGRNPHWDAYTAGAANANAVTSSLRRREAVLRLQLGDTTRRADELASLDGESSLLLASVSVAERHLAAVLTERARAEDAARAPSTGLRIVAPAIAPDRPAKSLRRALVLLSPVLGALGALIAALAGAVDRGRVFSPAEAAFWLNAPAIAATDWPLDVASFAAFTDELAEALAKSQGTILIVGAGPHERALVDRVAAQLQDELTRSETPAGSASRHVVLGWTSPVTLPAFRRAARNAAAVVILVESGAHRALALASLRSSIAADSVACALIAVGPALADRHDRVGALQLIGSTTNSISAPAL